MNKLKHKSILLLAASGLVLAGCGGESASSNPAHSENEQTSSSVLDSASQSGSEAPNTSAAGTSSSEIPMTSIDYTEGWSDELSETLRRNLGGELIPFIDFPGEIRAVWVDRISDSHYDYSIRSYVYETVPAHLYMFSTGAFDRTLLYNVKVTYERAGWQVTSSRDEDELTAENEAEGISVHFYAENGANGRKTPAADIFYVEPFKIPAGGTWSNATLSVLSGIGCATPHALPYTYLGKYAETALRKDANNATISGGDWILYERQILAHAKTTMPQSKKWTVSEGTKYTKGYTSKTYIFKKVFSDGYTVTATLCGIPNVQSYSYNANTDPVIATLEVNCVG